MDIALELKKRYLTKKWLSVQLGVTQNTIASKIKNNNWSKLELEWINNNLLK